MECWTVTSECIVGMIEACEKENYYSDITPFMSDEYNVTEALNFHGIRKRLDLTH